MARVSNHWPVVFRLELERGGIIYVGPCKLTLRPDASGRVLALPIGAIGAPRGVAPTCRSPTVPDGPRRSPTVPDGPQAVCPTAAHGLGSASHALLTTAGIR